MRLLFFSFFPLSFSEHFHFASSFQLLSESSCTAAENPVARRKKNDDDDDESIIIKKGFYSFDGVYLTLMVYLLGA